MGDLFKTGQPSGVLRALPGLLLCCGLAMAGEALVTNAHLPIPGAVLGLLCYLPLLLFGRGIGWSLAGAGLLTRWIGVMIVPALVGLLGQQALLSHALLPLLAVLVITTLLTAVATALLYRLAGGGR